MPIQKNAWDGDEQYKSATIAGVRPEQGGGWSIELDDGWSFYVPPESPVEPEIGHAVRLYGQGTGYVVRGLLLDGQCVYYRTANEQKEHSDIQLYGRDAADLLRKWDAGESVWSIEMGGFGPAYEQALQIATFEVIRHVLNGGNIDNDGKLLPSLKHLGLSGAQWGAARSLANALIEKGPIHVQKETDSDRHIMVDKYFPSLLPHTLIEAAPALLEALKAALPYVEAAVDDDGGIENCEVGDRMALEMVRDAISAAER